MQPLWDPRFLPRTIQSQVLATLLAHLQGRWAHYLLRWRPALLSVLPQKLSSSLCWGTSPLFLSCFYCSLLPLQTCLLTDSPYVLPFCTACFLLSSVPHTPQIPPAPTLTQLSLDPHSLTSSRALLCASHGDTRVHWISSALTKLMIQGGHCHMVPWPIQGIWRARG